jgi:hypothetical protein
MLRRKSKNTDPSPELAVPGAGQIQDLIASRAYELYESREGEPGDELSDWLTAEREILATMPELRAEAADRIGPAGVIAGPEPQKKSSKLMAIGGSLKKAGPTTPRSPAKPKGAHP